MPFLPVKNFTLYTDLTAEEAVKRLAANVYTKKRTFLDVGRFTELPYYGFVAKDSFIIKPVMGLNSRPYKTLIKGDIINGYGDKTRIDVVVRPDVLGIGIAIMLATLFIVILVALLTNKDYIIVRRIYSVYMLTGFFIFGYMLVFGSFMYECKKAESFLKEVLSSEEI